MAAPRLRRRAATSRRAARDAVVAEREVGRADQVVHADQRAINRRAQRLAGHAAFKRRPGGQHPGRQQHGHAPSGPRDGVFQRLRWSPARRWAAPGSASAITVRARLPRSSSAAQQPGQVAQPHVNDGIGLLEGRKIGHQRWAPGGFRRLRPRILAGREQAHDVPARAEERRQLRQHPAGSAGEHDAQAPPLPDGAGAGRDRRRSAGGGTRTAGPSCGGRWARRRPRPAARTAGRSRRDRSRSPCRRRPARPGACAPTA